MSAFSYASPLESRAPAKVDVRSLTLIAGVAIALRVGIALIAAHREHSPLWLFAYWGDGPSYVAQAKAMCGDWSTLTDFDRRVFPGFAALIAGVHALTGAHFEYAALAIPWACAGIAAAAAAAFFADRRFGWAMALLIPHYLSYSSMPMSEAPLMAFTLCGLLLARREGFLASVLGGALLGMAGMIRPVAAFAVIGIFCYDLYRRRTVDAFAVSIAAAVTLGLCMLLHQHWSGDALQGVKVYANNPAAYDHQIVTWPFHSLIATPRRADLPFLKKGKIGYIYLHVALVLAACVLLARRTRARWKAPAPETPLDVLCLPWLVANTIFVLCVGNKWGFLHFPRFAVPAMPAAFWAYRSILPRRWWVWAAVAVVSIGIAVDSVARRN